MASGGGGNAGNNSGGGDGFFLIVALTLAFPFIVNAARPYYNEAILTASNAMLLPISCVSGEAGKVRAKIKTIRAKEAEPEFVDAAWRYVGRWYRWILAPSMVFMALYIYRKSIIDKYKRRLNMWQLVVNNATDFPCLAPIVKVGPITDQPYNSGGWAVAKAPVQYLVENQVLLNPETGQPYPPDAVLSKHGLPRPDSPALGQNNRIDEPKLRELLVGQLGDKFDGDLAKLTTYQKGLALALIAHAQDRKDIAFKALDQLSQSWDKDSHRVDISGVVEHLMELLGSMTPEYVPEIEKHKTYVNVWFMAILKWARVKGSLPSSLWIWLRPTDRVLFYSLNQVGGRTAWTESVGPWSHYLAECAAGASLESPQIDKAVLNLRESLILEGWLKAGSSENHEAKAEKSPAASPDEKPSANSSAMDFGAGTISPDDYIPDIDSEIDTFLKQRDN